MSAAEEGTGAQASGDSNNGRTNNGDAHEGKVHHKTPKPMELDSTPSGFLQPMLDKSVSRRADPVVAGVSYV